MFGVTGAPQLCSGAATIGSDQSGFSRRRISCVGGQSYSHLHQNRLVLIQLFNYFALLLSDQIGG